MNEYNLKHYAHIGDAAYELFVREFVINHTHNQKQMHQMSVQFVNAGFQAELLETLQENLTPDEQELFKRGRNLPITVGKRNNPVVHHLATGFEVLIGHFYLNDKNRLDEIFEIIKKRLTITISK